MPHVTSTSVESVIPSCVCLIGAGTVGRAILDEHLKHGVEVVLVDANQHAIETACDVVKQKYSSLRIETIAPIVGNMPSARLFSSVKTTPTIVIESIPENLTLKQSLFVELSKIFSTDTIFASNTSNLRIASVFEPLGNDPRCCGLHFFMPVGKRPLVECVATPSTSPQTQALCESHAKRIGKQTLHVGDSPGFVVNRLLAPYLNQSLLMLEHGVDAVQLAEAAQRFGMPMSPLELIDTIGIRTAFDSGRVFWQAFPHRLDPAPSLPGMIKAGRLGAVTGGGFYDACRTSNTLSNAALKVIAKYQRTRQAWTIDDITQIIAIPMWIEAAEVLATNVVTTLDDVELAMRCGLGYHLPVPSHSEPTALAAGFVKSPNSDRTPEASAYGSQNPTASADKRQLEVREGAFFDYFDSLGIDALKSQLRSAGKLFRALQAPNELLDSLSSSDCPTDALTSYIKRRREAMN